MQKRARDQTQSIFVLITFTGFVLLDVFSSLTGRQCAYTSYKIYTYTILR